MELRGRSGAWNEATHTGNPVLSMIVSHAQQAYGRRLAANGIRERSATPCSPAKFAELVTCVHKDIQASTIALTQPMHQLAHRWGQVCNAAARTTEVQLLLALGV